MTSPDLIRALQPSRPTAPDSLRARVHELSVAAPAGRRPPRWGGGRRRGVGVGAPSASVCMWAMEVAAVAALAGPTSGQKVPEAARPSAPTPGTGSASDKTTTGEFGAQRSAPQALATT